MGHMIKIKSILEIIHIKSQKTIWEMFCRQRLTIYLNINMLNINLHIRVN